METQKNEQVPTGSALSQLEWGLGSRKLRGESRAAPVSQAFRGM
jgi:hypothetical protein